MSAQSSSTTTNHHHHYHHVNIHEVNPDVHKLFQHYNHVYFDNVLSSVLVNWSKRMTLCAGLCRFQVKRTTTNNKVEQQVECKISLSEKLLQFRPPVDTVNTLLHEMIHAYLFLTNNDTDRDGHGPEFQKWMDLINESEGTNITIYHSFHDEVEHFRVHWWQCGKCKLIIKRAMNRAPSKHDLWWDKHVMDCGGVFTKIKEPEAKANKKQKEKKQKKNTTDLTSEQNFMKNFLGKRKADNSSSTSVTTSSSSSSSEAEDTDKKKRKIEVDDHFIINLDNVQCPICFKYFSSSQIQLHADQCISDEVIIID